jgi:hypothetical protein
MSTIAAIGASHKGYGDCLIQLFSCLRRRLNLIRESSTLYQFGLRRKFGEFPHVVRNASFNSGRHADAATQATEVVIAKPAASPIHGNMRYPCTL